MTSKDLIKKWNINKQVLAELMDVNFETLKQKLLGGRGFVWAEADEIKVKAALQMLANQINNLPPDLVVKEWRMNRSLLAGMMKVDHYHFRMKLLGTNPNYKFSAPDLKRLRKLLQQLADDIHCLMISTRRVIDADRNAIIEMFDEAATEKVLAKYSALYEEVGVDNDHDIIVYGLIKQKNKQYDTSITGSL